MNNRYCNFEQYSGFLLILFVCLTSFPFVSPTNLCSTTGLCCKHRDSECVAQRVYPNHTVDTSQLPCYCDHACIELEDCCPDYRQFCGGKFFKKSKPMETPYYSQFLFQRNTKYVSYTWLLRIICHIE